MIELIGKTKIDFMAARKIAFSISGALSLLGLFALFQIWQGNANMGIDFVGGTAVQVKFDGEMPALDDIRSAVSGAGIGEFDLQDLPGEGKVLLRVKKKDASLGGDSEKIVDAIYAGFSASGPVMESVTEIGPKVGGQLRDDAFKAVVYATIFLLVYVAFRFQFRFGVGATIATFHDVLAVLGVFYLMGKEINLILISALLMIAGYSLTDTVVVFDRIRENLRKTYKVQIGEIVNLSINEVLSRTVIVSLTTLFTAASLYFFGGEVIHDFALAIVLGILVGTYSSIFVASPVVLLWKGGKPLGK